jgi:5S rRNA maturation endonuclease (ribonuclease M5)
MARRRGGVKRGWDMFENPVPGNVYACMEELGIEIISVSDDEITGKCPAHLERTGKVDRHPSWSVNAETGVHNCFSCGFSGNFVGLAAYCLGPDQDAVDWVRKRGGVERAKRVLDKHRGVTINELTHHEDTTLNVNEASLALFVDPPEEALAKRGLTLESAQYYGVLWDEASGSWITPVRAPYSDRLLGWQQKNERFFRNRPKDMEKSKALFGLSEWVAESPEPEAAMVLVESPLDVLRLHSAGIHGGVSSYGAEVSDEQMRLIISESDRLLVAMDNDKAGIVTNKKLKRHYAHRIRMTFLSYDHCPDLKDIGDMTDAQIHKAVNESFSSVLASF